ncbi:MULTISPECIES: FGGY-family carbohydrate kinase [unclassified Thioalkalivibrio]|uniref:FGGY-family carbohydrate kinase n=1 Tax=unclassified Thioalkalivibrio TaxID=2621013 RepID=UPI0003702E32|nr:MULTISPECIES: FGGY-family carbohydrate kinase [unclassified Thioalkalivibrio]
MHAIGIDLGTSGIRLVLLDPEGVRIHAAQRALPASVGGDEQRAEQNPALWWSLVRELLREAATQLDGEPAAIAVDGTSATLLRLDADGRPTHPVLMYNDARATDMLPVLAGVAPADSAVHSPSSSAAKLLWLRRHEGLSGVRRVLHQADWVAGRLRGRFDHMDENNALKLGYDALWGGWPNWLQETLGTDAALLPEVVPAGTVLGPLDPQMAESLHLNPACRVVAGTTDSIAGFLASGVTDDTTGVTSLGSTLVLKQLAPKPVYAPELGIYSHRLLGRWLVGGASNSGGAVLRQHFDDAALERLSDAIDPESDSGLDYLPLPRPGERFPVNDPELEPRLTPRPDDDARFLQGLFEGVARIERDGYQRLAELGAPRIERVVSLGGGARNPVWTRIRSRVLALPVTQAEDDDAARGAARLARIGVGLDPGPAD